MGTCDSLIGAEDGAAPRLKRSGLSVGDVVAATYADGIAAAAALADPALTEGEVRAAIDYCAAEACAGRTRFCPTCRKHTQALGITTLDQHLKRFERVTLTESNLTLTPGGAERAITAPSLQALALTWQGPEIWYLARRVIRRIKKAEEPREKRMAGLLDEAECPVLVLVRPQLADNIGMVARAMANFSLDDLRLVDPRDGWPNEKARAAASGANFIVDAATAYPSLKAAVADCHWICATTARQRDLAKPVMTPEQAVAEMRERMARGERCAVLFGPERTGLETDDVSLADAVVMAPVNVRFASLNLAQAVLLLSYEWMKATARGSLGRVTTYETPLETGLNARGSPPATKDELLGFFEHLEAELDLMGFFNPSHKRQTVMRNVRSMFSRMGATEQEVRTLRGIVATLAKGKGHGRKPST